MNKTVDYQGRTFFQQDGQPYYRSWNADLGRPDYLHRVIWQNNNGPIPHGFDVHHIDEDPENNEPTNLQALSRQDHRILHWESLNDGQKVAIRKNLVENARPAASNWHRSEEGRKWHSEKAKVEIPNRVHRLSCELCGCPVVRVGVIQKGRFCSAACKAADRRARGVDNEVRACAHCSAAFTVNRYTKTETCSRACANRRRKSVDRCVIGG